MDKSPVIDFHVHLANYEWFSASTLEWLQRMNPVPFHEFCLRYKTPDSFIRFLEANQVDYAVILAEICPITTGICTNEQVAEFCSGYQSLIPFCSLNPYMENRLDKKLESLVLNQGFKGIKLYPTYQYFYPNDALLYPLYAAAQELGIPVMFHSGSSVFQGARIKYGNPLYFDDVAVDFPQLNIIIVHGGRGFWYDTAYFLAKLHPNVYLEVAGLPPNRLLDYFPELEKISDKVIFGSDWPGPPEISPGIEQIRQLALSDAAKEKILGKNAAKILGFE